MSDEAPTIDLPDLRKASEKEVIALADRLVKEDWLPDLPNSYLADLISRVPLRLRRRFYDEQTRRNPDAGVRRKAGEFAEIPKSWTPQKTEAWTAADDAWLETCLNMVDHFDHFDPRDSAHQRPDDRYVDTPGYEPVPRSDFLLLRQHSGLGLEQLGKVIAQDKSVISRWETGRRPCDDRGYFEWLLEQAEDLAAEAALQVMLALMKRDGWHDVEMESYEVLWRPLYKPNGLFDKWRTTGTLPRFTPKDAGLAA